MVKVKSSAKRLNNWLKATNKLWLVSGALVTIMLIATAVIWQTKNSNNSAISSKVVNVTDVCAQKNTISFTCYKVELNDIVDKHNSESAFALLKQQYSSVPYVKSQCHQLVHVVGRAAYAKYGNLGDAFTHGDQFCWAGYYHGLMEQIADERGTDKFLSSLNQNCASIANQVRYSFDHYNCVHGQGHGVMEALKGDLFKALKACDEVRDSWGRTSCYGGVFMQNIMIAQSPDETVDHTTAYLKNDQPMYPCTAVGTQYKDQCYLMQTSHALRVKNYDFGQVFGLCKQVEDAFRITCYRSLGRDASGQTVSDVEGTKLKCLLGPDVESRQYCVMGAVTDFVAYFHDDQKAKELCASLPGELQEKCYNAANSTASTF
ncbi:MAG TPA: hypothetical protein VIK37_01335 [Candidatus Saccharimonadales bacterium]